MERDRLPERIAQFRFRFTTESELVHTSVQKVPDQRWVLDQRLVTIQMRLAVCHGVDDGELDETLRLVRSAH
jgi:hypothetical protein